MGELLRAMNLNQYSVSAAQPGLSVETVKALRIPVPPLSEQHAVASFLERETAKIDTLIGKQEQLITLLAEKRRALISHAVTRGLAPEAPLKNSGVGWLGQVPEHWEVKRLKHISPSQSVGLVINPSTYVAEEGVPFLFGSNVSDGKIIVEKARRITPEDSRLLSQSMLHAGDLVTVRVGYPGVTAVVPDELEGSNCASMMIIRRSDTFCSQWLCYAMNSQVGRMQVQRVQYGAAQEQFNISHAVHFWFPTPPLPEQQAIVEYLDHETTKLDTLTAKARRSIELMKEHRTALIAAAVTGQIDVSGYVDTTHLYQTSHPITQPCYEQA